MPRLVRHHRPTRPLRTDHLRRAPKGEIRSDVRRHNHLGACRSIRRVLRRPRTLRHIEHCPSPADIDGQIRHRDRGRLPNDYRLSVESCSISGYRSAHSQGVNPDGITVFRDAWARSKTKFQRKKKSRSSSPRAALILSVMWLPHRQVSVTSGWRFPAPWLLGQRIGETAVSAQGMFLEGKGRVRLSPDSESAGPGFPGHPIRLKRVLGSGMGPQDKSDRQVMVVLPPLTLCVDIRSRSCRLLT